MLIILPIQLFHLAEEILNDNKALWMSEESQMLLYANFNDTLVQELRFPWYGVDRQQLYPDMRSLRYPKVSTCYVRTCTNKLLL